MISLKQAAQAPFIPNMSKHNAPTLVPPSYPALEAEVYNLLSEITDRDTVAPPASTQIGLELECAGLEVEW